MGGSEEIGMSSGEIMWAMLILLVVLSVVTFFFCCLPVYRALQARFAYWEDPENDPRWNVDQFQFSPTSPQMATKMDRNKYNRLSTCSTGDSISRGSSFRNQTCIPRDPEQIEIKFPPAYNDIYNPGSGGDLSSLGSPPEYYSHSPSDTEGDEIVSKDKSAAQKIVESPAIVVTVSSEINKPQENSKKKVTPASPAVKETATEALRRQRAEAAKAKKAAALAAKGQETAGQEAVAPKAKTAVPEPKKTTQNDKTGEVVKITKPPTAGPPGVSRPSRRSEQTAAAKPNPQPEPVQEPAVQPQPRKVYKKPRKNPPPN